MGIPSVLRRVRDSHLPDSAKYSTGESGVKIRIRVPMHAMNLREAELTGLSSVDTIHGNIVQSLVAHLTDRIGKGSAWSGKTVLINPFRQSHAGT